MNDWEAKHNTWREKNREAARKYAADYYQKNKERILKQRKEHKLKIQSRKYSAEYYQGRQLKLKAIGLIDKTIDRGLSLKREVIDYLERLVDIENSTLISTEEDKYYYDLCKKSKLENVLKIKFGIDIFVPIK